MLVTGRERANQRAEEITEELRDTEYRWSAALQSAGDGVWDWNFKTNQFLFSDQTKIILKYEDDELGNDIDNWLKIIHPEDVHGTVHAMNALRMDARQNLQHEFRVFARDGRCCWILMRGGAVVKSRDGKTIRAIGTFTDITDRKAVEAQNEYFALHDELTGLPNRRSVNEDLESLRETAVRKKLKFALMFIDLDHFKKINDTYGHAVGDKVLRMASERLGQKLRLTDILGRFGGDEFVAILNDIHNVDDVTLVANNIIGAMSTPLVLGDDEVQVTLSIGIAIFDYERGDSIADLLRRADAALYETKHSGRNGYTVGADYQLA